MGLLSNAISGLQSSQNALRTTGHNISNSNTEGFSRQRVEFGTRPEQLAGAAGFIGSGVTTQSIERVVSEFLTNQLRSDTTTFNDLSSFNEKIGGIDSLLADPGTGLSNGLQNLFAAIQNGADDPASPLARQVIVDQSESLTSRFNGLYTRLEGVAANVSAELRVVISEINTIARTIGELNETIRVQKGSAQGSPPNDLLDKRDEQVRRLAELISIQVIEQDAGDFNIMIGNGQPLVVGKSIGQLSINNSNEISITSGSQLIEVTDVVNGGQIGGLLRFQDEVLNPTLNELGRVAIVLADEFNKVQTQGLDLDGDFGGLFFTDINDPKIAALRVIANRGNALPNDRVLSVTIDDTSQLSVSDYTFDFIPNTNNYRVIRNDDGEEVAQGILSGTYPTSIQFEGLTVHLTSGSFQGGDSFSIQPTRRGAVDIETLITRPEDIAFALPVRTLTGIGNTGTAIVSAGEVLSILDGNNNILPSFANNGSLTPPILIRFTSPTTYDVLDTSDPANPRQLDPPLRNQPYTAGLNNSVFTFDPGETIVTGSGASMGLPNGRTPTTLLVGAAALTNNYPLEVFNFTTTDPISGLTSLQSVTTNFGDSAANTAGLLSSIEGVEANAFTEAIVTDIDITNFTVPLQIRLNGESLVGYSGSVISSDVPDPAVDEAAFNDYLVSQINSNANLSALGFFASATSNPVTGAPEVKILNTNGHDLDIRLEGVAGDTISVNDGVNPNVRLTSLGAGSESALTVGGRIDLKLSSDVVLNTAPVISQFFGDNSAANFAQPSFSGYQVSIKGQPNVGDRFNIEFNSNATTDNRSALKFVGIETRPIIDGERLSVSGSYQQLVERVGTTSNLSQINTEASEALLEETQTARDAVSGVNLDEEAANLIRFEQAYNANARVISVARDLFDALLNAV
ncbi:hypothetical protein NBRC116493_19820 [Aurantivibrio infirmus]